MKMTTFFTNAQTSNEKEMDVDEPDVPVKKESVEVKVKEEPTTIWDSVLTEATKKGKKTPGVPTKSKKKTQQNTLGSCSSMWEKFEQAQNEAQEMINMLKF